MSAPLLRSARAAGVLYLTTHVSSVAAVAAFRSDATALGVTLEFALAIGCVGTGILVWTMLRRAAPTRAATFAALRGVEASVILTGALPLLATLLAGGGDAWSAPAEAVHAAAFLVGQGLVISVNTIVLGWLLWDTRAVPRALAALGALGGGVVLSSNLAQLWGVIPLSGAVAAVAAVPVFAFELWLAILLITVGLRSVDAADDARPVRTAPQIPNP
ncbi:DUF4386 family protein [Microbacterium dextranolyticum]|uniref:DUF4386 domain-containing protein n=1 Tax=Microbacterium dextranolyticum TaxID=36806 RepID=A0A9W6HPJ6_9MICO|nr:DUF4386 family protein [Microbacterium dextranolyticum]MBM7462379.1 hypothetical protein [Microbacterium dextranolyticum]GLJ96788.1 hypothetical protein GCM10017591_28510 [Microbacterium dextranolyticum]